MNEGNELNLLCDCADKTVNFIMRRQSLAGKHIVHWIQEARYRTRQIRVLERQ